MDLESLQDVTQYTDVNVKAEADNILPDEMESTKVAPEAIAAFLNESALRRRVQRIGMGPCRQIGSLSYLSSM